MVQLIEVNSPAYNQLLEAAGAAGAKAAIEALKNAPQEEEIGGVEMVMRITGYSRSSVYNKTSSGDIPSHKYDGQKTFYVKSEIIDHIKKA